MDRNIGLFENDKTFPLHGEQETLNCDRQEMHGLLIIDKRQLEVDEHFEKGVFDKVSKS